MTGEPDLSPQYPVAQAQEFRANAFEWPNIVGRLVVIALIVGLPIALTVAWYYGHRALRHVSVGELSILSALLLIGALFFTVALRRDAGFMTPTARALTSGGGDVLPNKVAAHELDEGFFKLIALRANVTDDDVWRQPKFADVLRKIEGD